MRFCDIVGQDELVQKFIHLIQTGHLPHAIMLLGPEGSGGLPLALAATQYLMCTDRSDTDSCGECSSCTKMNRLQHPDVHFSFPTCKQDTKSPVSNDFILDFRDFVAQQPYGLDTDWLKFIKSEKQGNITAAECREIIQKLQLRSFESEYKVMIMWCPEYLGNEGNILLKLIEEPTAKTILMFVANNIDEVLQTIQSRTQLFPLRRISDNAIQQALIRQGTPAEKALQIARMAVGNYQEAMSILHQAGEDWLGLLRDWLNAIYANKGLELVSWSHQMADLPKDSQKKFLEYVLQLFEHLVRFRANGPERLALLESEVKIIEVLLAKGFHSSKLDASNELLNDSLYQIERNANGKILFHSLSLRLQEIMLAKELA